MEPKKLARRLPLILVAGWLVPGASHALIGKTRKGVFIGAILLATFVVGLSLGAFRNVSWERHTLSFVGQAGMGLPWLVAWAIASALPVLPRPAAFEQLGLLYSAVAALLNVLCLVDVYERVVRANLPPPPPPRP